jgi:DNA-directed RNA polymerase specialized sigma24 family protein
VSIPEAELIATIYKVATRLANKYRFGYHSVEDIKQQAAVFALEGLSSYDGIRPLENFLWTHVRNRLYNYKRNNFERPDKPCFHCPLYKNNMCSQFDDTEECDLFHGWITRNTTKKNLMSAIDIDMVRDDKEDNMRNNDEEGKLDKQELLKIIETRLPIDMLEDFFRLKMGLKLRKARREKLVELMLNILKEHGIDTQAW